MAFRVQLSRLAENRMLARERPKSVSLQSVMPMRFALFVPSRAKLASWLRSITGAGSHVYSCAGVSIESATTVQLTKYQMEDLKQLVFSHRNKQLGARVWSAFGG